MISGYTQPVPIYAIDIKRAGNQDIVIELATRDAIAQAKAIVKHRFPQVGEKYIVDTYLINESYITKKGKDLWKRLGIVASAHAEIIFDTPIEGNEANFETD